MLIGILVATALATAVPTSPQPTENKEMVLRQPMLAEPTEFYALSEKKKRK